MLLSSKYQLYFRFYILSKYQVFFYFVIGLHTKEDAEILLPQTITKKMARALPKDVPEGLYEDFLTGKKHPISCLMEYCASTRLVAT